MQDALTNLQSLDNLWPEPWQHFVLGLMFGSLLGLGIFGVALLKGKVKL